MEVIEEKEEMRRWSRSARKHERRIALVPTMGFLHEGHLSLIRQAKKHAHAVVVSIYVNPTQFAPNEDFHTYPRNLQQDLNKLQALDVDAVFNPTELYARNGHDTWIRVENLESHLCGKSRPMFFRGVATVVAKLFNIVEPDVAIFGKKDYQQWRLISCMVRDLDIPVEIVGCELVRELDGLALSSRNVLLSPTQRQEALSISRSLKRAEAAVQGGETDGRILIKQVEQAISDAGGKVDYVEVVEQESLKPMLTLDRPAVLCVAAWFGNVRLIDNVELLAPAFC